MTRFGKHLDRTARSLVEEAVRGGLDDAGLDAGDIEAAFVGNAVSGLMDGQESVRAQVVLRGLGLPGIPVVNVENACASSSTALHLGCQAVAAGQHECVLVVGYEKLSENRARSLRAFNASMDLAELAERYGEDAGEGRSVFMDLYAERGAADREALALVSVKSHYHASLNPLAQYRKPVTVEEVLASRQIAGPLTVLMCSPLTDGAAALVLCSEGFAKPHGERVQVAASVLTSGRGDAEELPPAVDRAAAKAYDIAGAGPEDLDLVELHDATAPAELDLYEELGLCSPGEAARLVRDRVTWLRGRLPVNTSGGLISRGHPIGATGAAQVVELAWQLRGRCGDRQVEGARLALAQNSGGWIGTDVAACAVHVLEV